MDEAAPDPNAPRGALWSWQANPSGFRSALMQVPAGERDGWVDRLFGLGDLPHDGPDLPRGCTPYLPCSVDTVLRMVDLARIGPSDVFVDIGCGIGRAMLLTHLLTGARAIGIEVQSALVHRARDLAARLKAPRVTVIEGDAATVTHGFAGGSVFFLYCPFSGSRLDRVMDELESIARTRPIRVCSVNLPLPPRSRFAAASASRDLTVYRSLG